MKLRLGVQKGDIVNSLEDTSTKSWTEKRVKQLVKNRELHFIFGGGYVWCQPADTVGFLICNSTETWCDKCRQKVWDSWDTSSVLEQARWKHGRVIKVPFQGSSRP